MPRFDARAALAPEGATAGFGDLAAALLMAPQLRRKQDAEDQQRQDQLDYRDSQQQFQRDQLAQALGIHKDQMGLEQSKINNEKDYRQGENVRKWTEDFGTGLKNAAKLAIDAGGALTGNKKKSGTPSGTGWHKDQNGQFFRTAADGKIETYDPASDTIKKLGTGNPAPPAAATVGSVGPPINNSPGPILPEEMAAFRARTGHGDPIAGIAARRTAKQAVQATPPIPTTMGANGGSSRMPPGSDDLVLRNQRPTAAAQNISQAKPSGMGVRHADLADKVAAGMFPSMEAAAADAMSRGHAVIP